MLKWQKHCIKDNISKLSEITVCNAQFLGILRSQNVISEEEAEALVDGRKHTRDRAFILYTLVQTQSESFSKLKDALEQTHQSSALKILNNPEYENRYKFQQLLVDTQAGPLQWADCNVVVYGGTFGTRPSRIKLFDLRHENMQRAINEVEMLTRLDWHGNIVRCFIAKYVRIGNKQSFAVSLEDLVPANEYYKNNQNAISSTKKTFCKQLLYGAQHLHDSKVIHLDIRPENASICNLRHGKPTLKIGEFAMARDVKKPNVDIDVSVLELHKRAAAAYCTPEVLCHVDAAKPREHENLRLGYKTDVFCVGVTLYHLLSNMDHPFGNKLDYMRNIKYNELSVNQQVLELLRPEEKNVLLLSLQQYPEQRPGIDAIVEAFEIQSRAFKFW